MVVVSDIFFKQVSSVQKMCSLYMYCSLKALTDLVTFSLPKRQCQPNS